MLFPPPPPAPATGSQVRGAGAPPPQSRFLFPSPPQHRHSSGTSEHVPEVSLGAPAGLCLPSSLLGACSTASKGDPPGKACFLASCQLPMKDPLGSGTSPANAPPPAAGTQEHLPSLLHPQSLLQWEPSSQGAGQSVGTLSLSRGVSSRMGGQGGVSVFPCYPHPCLSPDLPDCALTIPLSSWVTPCRASAFRPTEARG